MSDTHPTLELPESDASPLKGQDIADMGNAQERAS